MTKASKLLKLLEDATDEPQTKLQKAAKVKTYDPSMAAPPSAQDAKNSNIIQLQVPNQEKIARTLSDKLTSMSDYDDDLTNCVSDYLDPVDPLGDKSFYDAIMLLPSDQAISMSSDVLGLIDDDDVENDDNDSSNDDYDQDYDNDMDTQDDVNNSADTDTMSDD